MIDLSTFYSIQDNLLRHVPRKHQRFMYKKINWKNRLTGLIGGRGTGKTTMLLQHLAEKGSDITKQLYISADNIKVEALGVYEIASQFFKMGGEMLVIDEIHKYGGWPREIKSLYDSFPKARIIFSGSSSLGLQLGKADLSRRAVFHCLPGLSFREYLLLAENMHVPEVPFPELLSSHTKVASRVLENGPVLGHFQEYLGCGIYPFFLEGQEEYLLKIRSIIEKVLYEDIVSTAKIKPANIAMLKRILWMIATSQPFRPNIDKMCKSLEVSKPTLYGYLDCLERSGLITGVMPEGRGHRLVRKPVKRYIENTNLLRAIAGELSRDDPTGTVRETFLQHQLRSAGLNVRVPDRGDFLVEGRWLLEAGGPRKGKKQLEGETDTFVAKDDIDVGFGNVIPMWLFGFLY